MQEIILHNNLLQVGILPELGASLSFMKFKDIDILRPMDIKNTSLDSNSASMFLMLPFCGRIRGGKFVYWGITRKMKKNQAGIQDPIHGDGWKSKWTVTKQSDTSVTLDMSHDKDEGFPFSYDAEVTYTLDGAELKVETTLTNNAILPMPCGMGIHPFFTKTKDMELKFTSKMVWANESDPIFDRPYPTPEDWQFKDGKPIKSAVFDTCFGGFNGKAEIKYPSLGYKIKIQADEQYGHAVLYSPKGKGFVCFEPCTNVSNAFNLAANGVIGTGINSIGKDQSITGCVSIKVEEE